MYKKIIQQDTDYIIEHIKTYHYNGPTAFPSFEKSQKKAPGLARVQKVRDEIQAKAAAETRGINSKNSYTSLFNTFNKYIRALLVSPEYLERYLNSDFPKFSRARSSQPVIEQLIDLLVGLRIDLPTLFELEKIAREQKHTATSLLQLLYKLSEEHIRLPIDKEALRSLIKLRLGKLK